MWECKSSDEAGDTLYTRSVISTGRQCTYSMTSLKFKLLIAGYLMILNFPLIVKSPLVTKGLRV